ncbi:MAG: cupin domain-containing protein [Cyclobacteriaceae bacterium]
MKLIKPIVLALLLHLSCAAMASDILEVETEAIIKSYIEDFRRDAFASNPMHFGIKVKERGTWNVTITGEKHGEDWEVILKTGKPANPAFIYDIEYETLLGIYEGKLNAITAQGKAFSSDYSPMDITYMEGYEPSQEEIDNINPFSFHFWTKGFPETIPFGSGLTREAHGADVVFFYYQKGFRSGWLRIQPKAKVRHDPREQAMPFPMMVIAIKGSTEGEMNGKSVSLSEGNALFIPAGTTHKWWNETDEASEAILVMFGEGA